MKHSRFLFLFAALLLAALLAVSGVFSQPAFAAEKKAKLTGVDVSDHNGYIDWEAAKKGGIDFAIIRIGWGDNIYSQDDSRAAYNMQQCEKYGIPYGVYIYSYALSTAAVDREVAHMIRMANGHTPDLGYWFDMEDADYYKYNHNLNPYKHGTELTNFCIRFLQKMKAKGYDNVGVYANPDYFYNVLDYKKIKNEGMVWLAHWDVSAPSSSFPCEMWQYSAEGRIPGGSGVFDMNIIFNTSYLYPYALGAASGRYQRVSGLSVALMDLNADGLISAKDFNLLKQRLFAEWDLNDSNLVTDLNRDGTVNLIDLALLKRQMTEQNTKTAAVAAGAQAAASAAEQTDEAKTAGAETEETEPAVEEETASVVEPDSSEAESDQMAEAEGGATDSETEVEEGSAKAFEEETAGEAPAAEGAEHETVTAS